MESSRGLEHVSCVAFQNKTLFDRPKPFAQCLRHTLKIDSLGRPPPLPKHWSEENEPTYAYWMFFLYSNIRSLNALFFETGIFYKTLFFSLSKLSNSKSRSSLLFDICQKQRATDQR